MADSEGPRSYQVAAELRAPAALSAACLILGGLSFVGAWLLAMVAAPELCEFFYQPRVLALVHTLTLGWISLTIIGVLYQFVPALTKRGLTWRAGSAWQVALFAAGAAGLVLSFWFGHLSGAAWSATVLLVATLLLLIELAPALSRAPRRDGTSVGILIALVYFCFTAALGTLYAWDKVYPFLGGSVLSNIAAHAHLGIGGWITLMICAVSYRVVVAFLLPTAPAPPTALRQICLLAASIGALAVLLLLRSRWSGLAALTAVVALLWYAKILFTIARTRRTPIDWAMRHVLAAFVHLFAALGAGVGLFFVEVDGALGSRVASAYGLLLLVGWISNFIIGIGSRMAPGVVGAGSGPLLTGARAAATFALLNIGIVAAAASLIAGQVGAFRLSLLAPMAAALLFATSLALRAKGAR